LATPKKQQYQKMNKLKNERDLFIAMSQGNEQAFTTIFFHYLPYLEPFILKMTRSPEATEEIIQDVFLALWNRREHMSQVLNHHAYLLTLSNNTTFNWLKKRAREFNLLEKIKGLPEDNVSLSDEILEWKESEALIKKAVSQLPPRKKEIFELSRREGLSHEEIAGRLKLSKNTVSNHMTEALKIIRNYIVKHGGDQLPVSILFVLYSMN
jgi:RNA polymerase sigma-70 factor (family 1)